MEFVFRFTNDVGQVTSRRQRILIGARDVAFIGNILSCYPPENSAVRVVPCSGHPYNRAGFDHARTSSNIRDDMGTTAHRFGAACDSEEFAPIGNHVLISFFTQSRAKPAAPAQTVRRLASDTALTKNLLYGI